MGINDAGRRLIMGYFSNGTEGAIYQKRYCYKCAHWNRNYGCPCLLAHELWNYEECNKTDSLLHKMIPRDGIENGECMFFVHADPQQTGDTRAELEKLLRKVAADGCPREGVVDCKITRNYGGAECVACWKRWASIGNYGGDE
jgi:hypothetical protein